MIYSRGYSPRGSVFAAIMAAVLVGLMVGVIVALTFVEPTGDDENAEKDAIER